MDENIFYTEDNEYKIKITKNKKFYTQSNFGKYNCTIEFYNSIDLPVLIINCTEKELYIAIQRISELSNNILVDQFDNELYTSIEFDSTGNFDSFFWIVGTDNIANFPDYPTDQDIMCYISIFSRHLNQNSLRIHLKITYSFLEVLIYNIYKVLDDIPYLNDINQQFLREFVEGELK